MKSTAVAAAELTIIPNHAMESRLGHIAPTDKIKIVTVDDFKVIDGDPRFDRKFAEFNASEMAVEWIKHLYQNGFALPPMPA